MTIDRSVPDVRLHIGDEQRTGGGGGVYEHVYPVTGEVRGPVPLAGPADVDAAVAAARDVLQDTAEQWHDAIRDPR